MPISWRTADAANQASPCPGDLTQLCDPRLQVAALHVVLDIRQVHAPQLAPVGHIAHRDGRQAVRRRWRVGRPTRSRGRPAAALAMQVVVIQVRKVPCAQAPQSADHAQVWQLKSPLLLRSPCSGGHCHGTWISKGLMGKQF